MKRPDRPKFWAVLAWATLAVAPGRRTGRAARRGRRDLQGRHGGRRHRVRRTAGRRGRPGRPDRRRRLVRGRARRQGHRRLGLIVAPGFIDLHTHSDEGIARPRTRLNANYLTQGVTTIVTGNCGGGVLDVARYFAAIDAHGAGTNVIHLVPHGDVRSAILGHADRAAQPGRAGSDEAARRAGHAGRRLGAVHRPDLRPEPIRRHRRADRAGQGRRAGTGGSTPRTSATRARGCSRPSTRRSRSAEGAGVPVHISHLKASGKANWGTVRGAIERIAAARAAGQARLGRPVSVHRLEHPAGGDGRPALGGPGGRPTTSPGSPPTRARAGAPPRDRSASWTERDGGASIRIARYEPASRVGRARPGRRSRERAGTTPLEVVLDIQRHGGARRSASA